MAKKHFLYNDLETSEIFMDSKNLPGFERERFEGRLEFPIPSGTIRYLGLLLLIIFSLFVYRLYDLQVIKSPILKARAEDNSLKIIPLWAERGRVLDRKGLVLADNDSAFRLVLDSGDLNYGEKEGDVEKLLADIEARTLLPSEKEKILESVKSKKDNVILADFSDWLTLEEVRKNFSGLPLRLESFSSRAYPIGEASAHLIGYLGKLKPEDAQSVNFFEINKLVGRSGVEEVYQNYLSGEVGTKLTEVDSMGETFSEIIQKPPEAGDDVYLSIDAGLQKRIYDDLKAVATDRGFKGGAAVVMDVNTGEVLSLASFPSFDATVLTKGGPKKEVEAILTSETRPLFNRAISGLYSSGSIIKPLYALAALEEKLITPEKEILSTGKLVLPNPFNPDAPSIFFDWKAHGYVDMRRAIAVSSNVYFFTIGGGFGDIKGLGVTKMREWLGKFGFGKKTDIDIFGEREGFVPSPEWKEETQKDDPIWRVGDTYNLAIGQGNFQTTPVQMAVFAASIANGGKILQPYVLKEVKKGDQMVYKAQTHVKSEVKVSDENLKVIQEGMNLATKIGTAQALAGINLEVGAKTGTAEIGSGKKSVNSWFIGYFPYDKPSIAMAVVLEGGNSSNTVGATAAMRQTIEWITIYRPDLLDTSQN